MNSTASNQRTFGLAPQLRARLMATMLIGLGILLVAATVLVLVLDLPQDILSALVILVVVAIFGLGFLLVRRWYVVRLDDIGYQVRFVRGAGERAARWADVEAVKTAEVAKSRCAVLELRDGRSTTIPVDALEGDSEDFLRELGRRLEGYQKGRRVS